MKYGFIVATFVGLAASVYGGTFIPVTPGEAVVPNEYIVRFFPGVSAQTLLTSVVPGASAQPLPELNIHKVTFPANASVGDAMRLAAHGLVVYVAPNRVNKAVVATPNDPSIGNQYSLGIVGAAQAWNIMPDAFLTAATAGTSRVKIGVIDTGIDCSHADFKNAGGTSTDSAQGGQLLFSLSLAPAGFTTTVPGATCPWQDDYGHGTHVAGIIGAATNNATGIASLGYSLQMVAYKGLDHTGYGDDATLMNLIMTAADAGVQIVSASWGAPGYSQPLQDAINYAWQRNTLFIAAAGNDGLNELFFPAGASHALGVAASDSSNNIAGFSNSGNVVGITAPGVAIYSTVPKYAAPISNASGYVNLSGTSMATPHVSALAGLLLATTPKVAVAAIAQRLQQSASSSNANGGWAANNGFGIINAYNALTDTLRTATTGALVGQVTDGTGTPESATLTVNGQQISTDSNGLYRFPAIPAGTYPATVTATGFATQNLSVTIAAGADTVFPVQMGVTYGEFTGTVKDGGVAVAGAIVQAISQTPNGPLIQGTAVTGLDGSYQLWVLPGTYDITASLLSSNSGTVTGQTVAASGQTAVNLTTTRFGTITGTVTNSLGHPVSGAQLSIKGAGFSSGAVADSNGIYKTIGLPNGTYTVDASFTGAADVIVNNVNVTPDTNTTVNIQFAGGTFPIGIFGTGVTAQGTLAADGAVDSHYTITASADGSFPGPNAFVVTSNVFPIGPWLQDGPNSKWIAPQTNQGSGNAAGAYTYRTTFDLTGLDPTTAVLSGQYAADNSAIIQLNGVVVGPSAPTFSTWTPFTISSGFLAGVNTLDFVVSNSAPGASPSGLRVDINGTAVQTGTVPVSVTLNPTTATLGQGQSQSFTVTVSGTSNQSVTWGISPAGVGSMNGNTYTAPPTISSQQTVTLTATSVADNTKSATAKITLNAPSATSALVVYGTGVTPQGTLAADGAIDSHYTITASADPGFPGPNAFVVTSNVFPIGPWLLDGPNSKWIAPQAQQGTGNAAGSYTYHTTFDLTGFSPASATLTGQYAADNSAVIKLNGVVVGPKAATFSSWTPFTIASGFVAGINTLDFVVANDPSAASPTGLRVDLSGTATPSGPVPISVALNPTSATLTPGQSQAFIVTVSGTTNQSVTWTISPAGIGSMNGNTYTAPATIASQQMVTLTATSAADNTKSAMANVTLNPPPTTSPIPIFGTGVVSQGTLAADGAVDSHYTITASADPAFPGPNAFVVTSNVFPIGPWLLDGPNSKWIAPQARQSTGNAAGSYTYHTTFDLTGFSPASATLTGQYAADNSAIIKLNGVTVGPRAPTFSSWTPFTITSGFVAGINTLDFIVANDPTAASPTGLRVDISGTATPSGPAPISVTLNPTSATLTPGQPQAFTVTVSGTTNQSVTWTISPAGIGSMNGNTYTAPATITSQQMVTLTATSVADNTKSATAHITLNPPTSPVAIFGTGVVSAGTLAADGAIDSHYTISASADPGFPGPNAFVVTSNVFPIGPWLLDGPNSKWIAPQAKQSTGNATGSYTYHTTFDLTGFNPATATLTGQFAADNSATIKLNGVVVGPRAATYSVWTPFTLTSGFVAGVNTLDFVVTNDPSGANPTGLRVDISGTVSQ